MGQVRNKPCVHEGCFKQPCFNHPGKMPALFCYTHKVPGMVNVKQKACAEPECPNRPSFNHPGSGLALFCSKHRAKGMVRLRRARALLALHFWRLQLNAAMLWRNVPFFIFCWVALDG